MKPGCKCAGVPACTAISTSVCVCVCVCVCVVRTATAVTDMTMPKCVR